MTEHGENNQLIELVDCVNFAALKHSKQRRKDADSTPYINHPIGTTNFNLIIIHNSKTFANRRRG